MTMKARLWVALGVALLFLVLPDTLSWAQDTDIAQLTPAAVDEAPPESTVSVMLTVIRVFIVLALIFVGILFRRLLRQTGVALLYLGGFALIFAGERLWPDSWAHWPLTVLGLVGVLATIGLRLQSMGSERNDERRDATRTALIWTVVGASSLVLYFLTTDTVVDGFGFDEDAEARWTGTWTVLIPIVWLVGTLPMVFLDTVLGRHPVMVPPGAAKAAAKAGLATALGLSLLFPLNYLAEEYDWDYDAAYFKTTEAGTSTLALVRTLPEPVTAYLFYPAGNDVKEEVLPYFESLEAASSGMFGVQVVDQALVPELSKELRVRENGYIALVQGEANQKFKVGTDLDRAQSRLKKLDETVQEHLLELAKGKRVAYMLTGHGEASARERDNDLRKLSLFKQLLDAQSFKVENFGVTEGSADAVPDDASLVIIAAPDKPLLPEEEQALVAYLDRGGSLLVMVEPGGDPLPGLMSHLGLRAGEHPLAHPSQYIRQTRGINDRVLLATNRFGSHESVTTLSRNSTQLYVIVPTVARVEKVEGASGKVTTLIRSLADTFEDVDNNREKGEAEESKVFDLAVAVEGGDEGYRAVVVGDVNAFSDPILQFSQGNAVLSVDSVRWLVGDEELAGETESEEDVRIQHTRDQDVAWFWSTMFFVPALIFVAGLFFIRTRRTS